MDARTLTYRDGTPGFYRSASATDRQVGTVVIIHGALEHGLYYEHVAERLTAHGWGVLIPDLRGLGQTGGPRMHVTHFDDYLADLDELLAAASVVGAVILLGHSMGGLVAIRYAQTRPQRVRGLILSAPLLKVALPIHPWVLAIGWQLSRIFPRLKFRSGIRSEHLSRNPEYLERRRHDPLVRGRVTAGWFRASQAAMQAATKDLSRWAGPVLLLQGTDDRVTSAPAAIAWARAANAEIHELSPQRHALFQEPESEATLSIVTDWLAKVG